MTSSTRTRGYLPHLESQEAIYFVTFRLADSLPKELVLQLLKERDTIQKARLAETTRPGDLSRLRELRALMKKAERYLDRGHGHCICVTLASPALSLRPSAVSTARGIGYWPGA